MELNCYTKQQLPMKRKRTTTQTKSSSWRSLVKHVWLKEAKDKNFVFSPFSIYSALSLLASGSDGHTLKQLLGFLKRKNLNDLNTYVSEIVNSLDSTTHDTDGGGPTLSLVSGVWVDSSSTLKPSFKETATSIYRANAEAVDFKTQAKEVTSKVNKWAEENTNGLIMNLLPDGAINENAKIVLANALYFRGSWEKDQFNPLRTKQSDFYLLNGTSVKVPFMTSCIDQYISCFDSFKVLKLPYKQATNKGQKQRLSMYIFLPNEQDGLVDLIEKVDSESGFLECHLPKRMVDTGKFWVPKFKILFDFELSRVLEDDLGLDLPFDEVKADLTKMLDCPKAKNLFVSKAIHKCFVEVDAQGTIATAASSILGRLCCSLGPPRNPVPVVDFVADHPFMFIIRDDINRVVLFMGHVLNPSFN